MGHAKGSVNSKYIRTLDAALIMAADTISEALRIDQIQADRVRVGPQNLEERPWIDS